MNFTDYDTPSNESLQNSTPTDYSTTPEPKKIFTYIEIPDFILAILQMIAVAVTLPHLTILTRKDLRSNAIYRMMIGICICDIISQVMSFIMFTPFWIRSIEEGEECYVTIPYRDAFLNRYGVILLDDTQRSSTWLGVLMALYRVLSVMFPMSQRMLKFLKPWVIPVVVTLTVLLNGIVSVAVMWNKKIVKQEMDFSCNGTLALIPEDQSRYLVLVPEDRHDLHNTFSFVYGIVKALPSLIEPVLAALLILELRKASKLRKKLKKSDEKDNTTSFILLMTLSSFVLEVPNGFSHATDVFFEDVPLVRTISYLIMAFAEIFPVINSFVHPLVCFFMSSQYRETTKTLFGITEKQKVIIVEEWKTETVKKTSDKTS